MDELVVVDGVVDVDVDEVVVLELDVEDFCVELLELNVEVEDTFVDVLKVLCSELLVVDDFDVELLTSALELIKEALEVELTDFDVVLEIVPLLLLPTTVSVEDLLVLDVDGFRVEVLKVEDVLVAFD